MQTVKYKYITLCAMGQDAIIKLDDYLLSFICFTCFERHPDWFFLYKVNASIQ